MKTCHVLCYLCPLLMYTLSNARNQENPHVPPFSSMRTSLSPKSSHVGPATMLILLLHFLQFPSYSSPFLHFFLLLPFSAGQGADPLVLLTGGATISVDGPYLASVQSLPSGGCQGLPSLPDTRCQAHPLSSFLSF